MILKKKRTARNGGHEKHKPSIAQIPKYLSINELSKTTGVSKYYIRNLIANKEISYLEAGRKFLINYEMFIEYLNEQSKMTLKK